MKRILKTIAGAAIGASVLLGFSSSAEAANGKVTVSALNVRTGPSVNYQVIGKVKRNIILNYTPYNASWALVNFNGKKAYVSTKYLQVVATPKQIPAPSAEKFTYQGKVTASFLNVRAVSGTNNKIVGKLKRGTIVNTSNKNNGWIYISSGNTKGWVFGKYITNLTTQRVETPSATNSKPAIPIGGAVNTSSGNTTKPVATGYKTMDIRYPSRVTAEEINRYIESYEKASKKRSVFHGKGQMFIDIATAGGVNQLLFSAMAIHESKYGTGELATKKYNIFSLGAFDANPLKYAHTFQSPEHALRYQIKFFHEKYLNPSNWRYKGYYLGGATGGINYYYATDKQWGEKIANHANKIHPFRSGEYTNISIMSGSIPVVAEPIKVKR